MGETKSFDSIRKWLANKKNAAIFASILGIVASEMLMAAKILVIALTSHTYWNYMANFILFFISSLVFFLAFRGLKKERESIVLIFIFAEGIILFFMGIDALRSLYILIAHPGCEIYWPFVNLSYCEYDSSFSRLFFQYIPYGTIIYFILSCALYRTIWRGYKFLQMANLRREIPRMPIPTVCNTSYDVENLSTAPEPAFPSTHVVPSTHNESLRHQNQPPGDWPTFFDHRKCVEHERNILRKKHVVDCSPYKGKLLQNQCMGYFGSKLYDCEKIECEPYSGSKYTCAPIDQKPSGDLSVRHVFGRINAQTSEGNIDVNHCGGENTTVTLSTSSGNVNVANCTGELMLKTSGGDLDLNNLRGTINARTIGGNIRARTLIGNITVQSSGGNLGLIDISGEISATTTGGNIFAAINVTGGTQVKSYGGNVNVWLVSGHYNLKITGTDVRVKGLNNFNGTQTKNSVKGQLNGGGAAIVVSGATVSIYVIEESDDE